MSYREVTSQIVTQKSRSMFARDATLKIVGTVYTYIVTDSNLCTLVLAFEA